MKYKIKSNRLKDVIVIAFFALLAYMYIVILFKSGKIFPAADRLFHIERFEEEFKIFQSGHLVSMISTFSFSKVGQAINVYYPWGNLIPYGIIRSIVNKPVTAYYFYIGLEQFLGLLIAYFSANKISKSRKLAFVFAIVLRFSAYVLFNDFPRFDVGEAWALIFIPLTLAGFYNLVIKNSYLIGSGCMALGLTAELYCHILTSLITVVTLIVLYVISFLFQSHKVKILFSLICSVIIFLVLTSGFIIPLIFSMFQNKVIAPVIGLDESFNGYLAKSKSLSQVVNLSLNNHISGLEPNIGLVLLVTVFLGIVVFNQSTNLEKTIYLIGTSSLLLGTTLLPWMFNSKQLIQIVQFPWRLFTISIVFLAYFTASKVSKKNISSISVILVALYCGLTSIDSIKYIQNNGPVESISSQNYPRPYTLDNKSYEKVLTLNNNSASDVRYLDYLPNNAKISSSDAFNHKTKLGNQILFLNKNQIIPGYQSETFKIPKHRGKSGIAVLPFYIYDVDHYILYVDGKKTNFKVNKGSLLTFQFKTNNKLTATVKYQTPVIYIVARYVSLGGIIILLVIYFIIKYRSHRKTYLVNKVHSL
ncbi:hypothetical protein LPAF129_09910 [Ligilactobacillus pabuli]|uniref:Membrane protein YfhO n=1 Tax=Ligilactobacillus pabuli TaxID=2886039 RepID=A0ABQ5JH57_9LACO|nr:hypothetical protein [Ligilactobacillus pabuli]GKS81305.1 hypothetical protein LPAF129_09910 [Ligilactobacillus pabuli]